MKYRSKQNNYIKTINLWWNNAFEKTHVVSNSGIKSMDFVHITIIHCLLVRKSVFKCFRF